MHDDTTPECASQVLLCPTCGATWGRVIIPGAPWAARIAGCILHPFLSDAGGSFIPSWRGGCPPELPVEVLAYEARLRFNQLRYQSL
jgi:hypothetical protein